MMTPSRSAKGDRTSRGFSLSTSGKATTVLLLLLLALALRLWGLNRQSITPDEVWELHQAQSSLGEIVVAEDGFPPLYSLLLHGWMTTSDGIAWARMLSVLFGCLAVIALWKLSVVFGLESFSLLPPFLLALSPYHIWYSQEARAYSLAILIGTLNLWAFFRARQLGSRGAWVVFSLITVAGLYTHYLYFLLPGCLFLILLLDGSRSKPRREWLTSFVLVGVLALPLLPVLHMDMKYQVEVYQTVSPFNFWEFGRTYYSYIGGHALGPSIRDVRVMNPSEALAAFAPWIALVALGIAAPLAAAARVLRASHRLLPAFILVVLPVVVCGFMGNALGLGYSRSYAAWIVVVLLLLLGVGFGATLDRLSGRIALAALCLAFSLAILQRQLSDDHQNTDYRSASQFIQGQERVPAPIFATASGAGPLDYHLQDEQSVTRIPVISFAGDNLEACVDVLRNGTGENGNFWLVYDEAVDGDPGGWFKKWLLEQAKGLQVQTFSGLEIYLGSISAAEEGDSSG